MNKIHLGYIRGTHGLRGDLIVNNKFKEPELAYKVGNKIYLNEEEHTITYVKEYKNQYLIEIDKLIHINLVEKYKGFDVYIDREELGLGEDDYLVEDLIGLTIISGESEYGKVEAIESNGAYNLLKVSYKKEYLIPLVDAYLEKVDLKNNKIYIRNVEGLII